MGWKEKTISKAGRDILIKTVAQAIPTYSMSIFKFPKKVCDDINSVLAKYWWGQTRNEKKISSASDLAIPKHRTEYVGKKTKPNASQSSLPTLLHFVWIMVVVASIPKRRMIRGFGRKCGKWMFHRRCEPFFGEHALRFSPHGLTLLEGDYLLIHGVTSTDTKKKRFVMSYGSAH